MQTVKSLIEGQLVQSLELLVEKKSKKETKTGNPYFHVILRDKTGSIETMIWNEKVPTVGAALEEGKVFFIEGVIESYKGKTQLNIKDVTPSLSSADDFVRRTAFSVDLMWNHLVSIVGKMEEPLTKYVAEEILLTEKMTKAFQLAPAARGVHNNWFGGLLEHVYSLCLMAEPIVAHYKTHYYPSLSKDKVMFGLMLHDAGKVVEYEYSKPAFDYTLMGSLTPHIVLGPAWVYEKANQCTTKPENFMLERAHLMHLLAAHHGPNPEWGSPVKPASLEALLVHHLDNMDSKILHAWGLMQEGPGDIPGMSKRSFYEKNSFLLS